MAYTALDTPALVRRIDADLEEVVAAVREADPHLRALVLTGGFARGEGSVRDGEPQNDYDFVAVRGWGRPREPYRTIRARLERLLGLHVDLAPVPAWRLRWAPASIFWYETALRGRVLWGEDLLARIAVRRPEDLDPREALRLLANRAAGLLLVTDRMDGDAVLLQAAKATLAAFDVHLLAAGHFPPSQSERWRDAQGMLGTRDLPRALGKQADAELFAWAFHFKTDPGSAPERDPHETWRSARRVLQAAVPIALRHAGFPSLDAAAKHDSLLDRATHQLQVRRVPGARRFVLDATGRIRVATLRLLEATPDGQVDVATASRCFAGIADMGSEPLRTLEALRSATRQ